MSWLRVRLVAIAAGVVRPAGPRRGAKPPMGCGVHCPVVVDGLVFDVGSVRSAHVGDREGVSSHAPTAWLRRFGGLERYVWTRQSEKPRADTRGFSTITTVSGGAQWLHRAV